MRSITITFGPAEVPVHLGHVQQLGAGEVAPQLRGVGGLAHQVELVEDGLLVLAHDLDGTQPLAFARVVAGEPASAYSTSMSRSIISRMPGRSTLTTTSSPVRRRAACTCAIEAAASGVSSNSANTSLDRAAVGALGDRARLGAGKRRHVVLQLRELVGDVGGQQVAARGQRLAELDEDRPQFLEREAQALAARIRRCGARTMSQGER